MRKLIIIAASLAALAIPTAAMAEGTAVPYAGNGFTGGALNTQQDNNSGERYLAWVLSANGATSATITLPDGTHDMTKVGGTFKFTSEPFKASELQNVSASYEGKVKGNVKLVVSHGYLDTNIPDGTSLDENTGTGTTNNLDGKYSITETFTHRTWWSASDMAERYQQTVNVYSKNVAATPILGDFTGEIVGYKFTGPGTLIANVSSTRTGTFMPDGVTVNYGHYNWGGAFTVGASATVKYTNLMVDGTPLPYTPTV